MQIRPATANDSLQLADIYNYYIKHTTATFAEENIDAAYFDELLVSIAEQELPFLVLQIGDKLVGYAYATAWKPRSAYRFSLECCVYLRHGQQGQGLGKKVYGGLIEQIKDMDKYHLLVGGVTLPNAASIGLHESLGFEKVAHFKEVGYKFGQWLDVAYWSLKI